MLDDIGFTWNVYGDDSDTWMKNYQALKQFKDEEGHCLVPSKFERSPTLGIWVITQRQQKLNTRMTFEYLKMSDSQYGTEQHSKLTRHIQNIEESIASSNMEKDATN